VKNAVVSEEEGDVVVETVAEDADAVAAREAATRTCGFLLPSLDA
jgi:hypothetical protein